MYFEEEDRFGDPDLLQVVRRELYAINSHLEVTPYGLKYIPTHTEDGIPIRKLYVSNLPPKTTRAELHDVFAQYGFIKSCWLRIGDKGPNRTPSATYAFVTFSNPADAHKALQAPAHEKTLRGRNLRISPADSWHQPVEESDAHYQPNRVMLPTFPVKTRLDDLVTLEEMSNRDDQPTTSENSAGIEAAEVESMGLHHELMMSDAFDLEEFTEKYLEYRRGCPLVMDAGVSRGVTVKPTCRYACARMCGESSSNAGKSETPAQPEPQSESGLRPDTPTGLPEGLNILDILNRDCLTHILSYVPIRDLILSERVSKTWQSMVHEYVSGIRVFKTSWWQHVPVMLTTAVLRRVLQRVGNCLARLHIDHNWSALNDRTAHTIGKFCPNLDELKIVGMHTRNWNPLIYGCKQLKSLAFVSCNKLTDSSLVHLVKNESCIESLTVANNTHVTGLFLTGSNPRKLTSLSFYNCYSLQGTVLSAAIDSLPDLTVLRLDVCPYTMWKIIPMILTKLPKLQELSLSEYISAEMSYSSQCNDAFCDAVANLTELRILNLSRNIYITNAILKRVARCCPKLEILNISSCNSRRNFPNSGVSDEGVLAVCRSCKALETLDVSYLGRLSDAGLQAVSTLPRLTYLTARGNPAISAAPLSTCVKACPLLKELDVCGCDSVSEDVVEAAVAALQEKPRLLTLYLAATAISKEEELPTHKLLSVDIQNDRSKPHLRPDFVDQIFEGSSDDSLGDLYDHDEFNEFFGADDENFLDEEDFDNYDGLYQFGLHAPNIILL